jgi:hypothetical protein
MKFVYLLDPMAAIGSLSRYSDIMGALQGHFDKVAAHMKERILVAFIPAVPTPTAHDLIIYFVPSEISIVSQFAGRPRNPITDDGDGFTAIKTSTSGGVTTASAASEVYLNTTNAKQLAALAFHEAMHNRLALGDRLHARDGMAQATVTPDTSVTPANASQMAAGFARSVKQWPDGVLQLVNRRIRRDGGDPLWYT